MNTDYSVNRVCMAKEKLANQTLSHLVEATAHLAQLPKANMRLANDEEADVLYVHFEDMTPSSHSEMPDDGIILAYKGSRLVGVTILEASKR